MEGLCFWPGGTFIFAVSNYGSFLVNPVWGKKKMKAQDIYNILRAGGLSRAGALGMLGNMMAESTLKENIVQRGMTNLSDDVYTAAADSGMLDFAQPVGYGLCQWTLPNRKRALMARAKEEGVSVGDGPMQVAFALFELQNDFNELYEVLCKSENINDCSDLICKIFERPAVNNLEARRKYANDFAAKIPANNYKPKPGDPIKKTFPPDPTVLAFQLWLNYNGYSCEANGYKSKEFFRILREFVDDMEAC